MRRAKRLYSEDQDAEKRMHTSVMQECTQVSCRNALNIVGGYSDHNLRSPFYLVLTCKSCSDHTS